MASSACRSVAVTISSRKAACSPRIVSSSARGSRMRRRRALEVVDIGGRQQFRRLRFGPGIAEKVAPAHLGAREVFEQVRLAERRMTLDVEMKAGMVGPVGRR